MSKRNDSILKVLNVFSWIIFIGLCVEAGAILTNFVLTLFRPVAAHDIYKGLDLSVLYENQFPHYIGVMSFVVVLAILKAYLFFLVVKIFRKLNLVKPFTAEIAGLVEKISYEAFAIAVVSVIADQYTTRLIGSGNEVGSVGQYWGETGAFFMMAAILFVIAQVFRKGIELQEESELTV